MTSPNLNECYFKWLVETVGGNRAESYKKILRYLHNREFIAVDSRDENRIQDGLDMRHYFSFEVDPAYQSSVEREIRKPCSVLEVMVSMAARCERDFMRDKSYDDRTDEWFWDMMHSSHMDELDDSRFYPDIAEQVVDRIVYRQYEKNGDGGFFTVTNPTLNMPAAELWYQLCWYQSEKGESK